MPDELVHGPDTVRRRAAPGLAMAALLSLAGCGTLPSSGPTGAQIMSAAHTAGAPIAFDVVDIGEQSASSLQRQDALTDARPRLTQLASDARVDAIGPGDVLAITIYEVGVSLFGGGGAARAAGGAFDPAARGEKFPAVQVSSEGKIRLPYVGVLAVAGRTVADVQQMIERALADSSQRAQALVSITDNVSSTVYVLGEVRKPGRLPLTPNRERLLDAIASAGGTASAIDDTVVRVVRAERTQEQRLGAISPTSADDILLAPGDRIELLRRPRSYVVLGATAKVSQVSFDAHEVSLAEAIARVGGPSDTAADPTAVFLFRDKAATGDDARPVIYRLDLLEPGSYVIAQRVKMRDKDVLYFANASANQPTKLFAILNLLFAPFIAAREVVR